MEIDPVPFEPRRFRTAAAHYLAGRVAYPPRLISRVAEICGLEASGRLLDLGCGPGQLAKAFAPFVRWIGRRMSGLSKAVPTISARPGDNSGW
jgi:trans-aconitate methyltransferase